MPPHLISITSQDSPPHYNVASNGTRRTSVKVTDQVPESSYLPTQDNVQKHSDNTSHVIYPHDAKDAAPSISSDATFSFGCASIPKESATRCEDLSLIHGTAFGVFDGVGCWTRYGFDPTIYTGFLVDELNVILDRYNGPMDQARMIALLEEAHENALSHAEGQEAVGSTTVTLCYAYQGVLHIYNLGDSGVIVLRKTDNGRMNIVLQTTPQQHYHNTPYQMGYLPKNDDFKTYMAQLEGCQLDSPQDGDYYTIDLEEGDVIIAASDGLFDNVDVEYIASLVEIEYKTRSSDKNWTLLPLGGGEHASNLADIIARAGKYHALNGIGPLQLGKDDDITVVVASIQ